MSSIKRRRGVYDKQKLIDAINAVKEERMTSVTAAHEYNVSQSTTRSHTTNSNLRIGAGRSRYLTEKEEGYLVDLL